MVEVFRQLAARTLTLPGVIPLAQRWNHDLGVIFMLHRFAWPERGIPGQQPDSLRLALAFLRRHRFRLVRVDEALEWARTPEAERSPGPVVAFTLDDGYADQAHVAAPIFAEFDVPATIFPTTGFMDGELWMWWDRLRFMIQTTDHGGMLCPELRPAPEEVPLDAPADRSRVLEALERTLKRTSVAERERRLTELSQALQVELPDEPPEQYAPMSWADARRCESAGIGIGAHTRTHPTLACEREDRVREEVRRSWERIQAEMDDPVPIFCYPNGRFGDFGRREAEIARETGFAGAVTAEPGYVRAVRPGSRRGAASDSGSPFELPRYSLPDLHRRFVRIVTGLSTAGSQPMGPAAPPRISTDAATGGTTSRGSPRRPIVTSAD